MVFSRVGLGCRVRVWVRVGLEDEETVWGWLVLVGLIWLGLGYGFRLGGDRMWVLVSVGGLGLIRCGSWLGVLGLS